MTKKVKVKVSWITPEMQQAVATYIRRQGRKEHPEGEFDRAGRWYPSEGERDQCARQRLAPRSGVPPRERIGGLRGIGEHRRLPRGIARTERGQHGRVDVKAPTLGHTDADLAVAA